jgi:hypothetical protein
MSLNVQTEVQQISRKWKAASKTTQPAPVSLLFCNCSSFVAGDKNADPGSSSIPGLLGPAYHHASHH